MSNYFKHKMRSKNPAEIAGWVILAIVGFTGLVILFGFIIMWLWNWLMPELFGLPVITYWQGLGICLLSKILFGGIGGGKSSSKSSSKKSSWDDMECKDSSKNEISKWKFYDKFWEDHGNEAFESYVAQKRTEKNEEE